MIKFRRKRLRKFPKVTQLVNGEAGIWTQAHLVQKAILSSFTEGVLVPKIGINVVFDFRARLCADPETDWGMLGKVLKLSVLQVFFFKYKLKFFFF